MHYYVLLPSGQTCGHIHREINRGLSRCWGAKPRHRVVCVSDVGRHDPLTAAALAPLRAFLPTRGRGRPAGQTPRVEQASPLYARLSTAERTRFEAIATAAGFPDLGTWALALMEREAAAPAGFGAPVAPGVYSNTLDRAPLGPEHIARAIEACDPHPGGAAPSPDGQTRTLWHESE